MRGAAAKRRPSTLPAMAPNGFLLAAEDAVPRPRNRMKMRAPMTFRRGARAGSTRVLCLRLLAEERVRAILFSLLSPPGLEMSDDLIDREATPVCVGE